MKEILDYITNNITETTGNNVPQYASPVSVNGNVFNDLRDLLTTATSYSVLGSLYNEMNQNTIFYGYYIENSDYYGFVYLVDSNMEEMQLITTFSSGTRMFPIIAMHQDENNYMYALSYDFDDPSTARVLLLNNIFGSLTGTYSVILRESYIIPDGNELRFSPYYPQRIAKVPGEATYYIIGRALTSTTVITEFKINVGSENEWNRFILGQRYDNIMFDTQFEKQGDNNKFYFCGVSNTTPEKFVQFKIENSEITLLKEIQLPTETSYTSSQIFCKNKDEVYFSCLDIISQPTEYNRIFKIEGNTLTKIYEELVTSTSFYNWIYFKGINNIIFAQHTYGSNGNNETELGIMQDDVLYFASPIETINANPRNISALSSVNVAYNLIMMYAPGSSATNLLKFEYNPNNYNGLEYSSYNELVPAKARLFSNHDIVFARNLYNLTLNGAITTATVQIPNTLLNNITIDTENLIGETNAVLISQNESITKNIYETLFINFIQTLSVIDEDENITYPNTASYINTNINTGTMDNCNHSFIGKVRINYANNTIMQNITWTYNTNHYETSFIIDSNTNIPLSIDFMSNDETTIYINKELDLQSGNYYLISQKLRIE